MRGWQIPCAALLAAPLVLAAAGVGFSEPGPGSAPTSARGAAADSPSAPASEDPAGDPTLERIQVLGVRTGALDPDLTVFSDSIDLRDLEGDLLRLDEVLGDLAGVHVRHFGGAGERSELSIRGSTSAQVVVRIDGLRLDTAQSGSVDLSTLPIDLFERVDVRRGGGAVRAGSGAIGGVIDLQPRWPAEETQHSYRLAYSSFDTWEGSLFRSATVGKAAYTLGYAGLGTKGDYGFQRPEFSIDGTLTRFDPPNTTRINNDAELHTGLATLRVPLAEDVELRFLDLTNFTSRGEPGPDTGAGAIAGQNTRAHSRNFRNAAQLVIESQKGLLPGEGGGSIAVSHRYERNTFNDPIPALPSGEPISVRTRNSSVGGRGELYSRAEWRGLDLDARAGVEGNYDRLDASDSSPVDRRVVGAWLQVEATSPFFDTRVVPSLRVDATQGFKARFLPAIGIVLDPTPWLRLRAHIERSFRAPNLDELFFPDQGFAKGNPDLHAETATVYDGGVELLFEELGFLDEVSVRVTGFLHDIDESIVWFRVSPTTIQPRNTGKVREVGAEVAVEAEWTRWVRVAGNLTWLDATFDATGVDLPGRTPLEATSRLEIGDPDWVKAAFVTRYVGEIPVTEGGTQQLASRTTFDLSAALNIGAFPVVSDALTRYAGASANERRIWLAFRAQNFTDIAVRDALFFPQPGRTLHFSLEGSF